MFAMQYEHRLPADYEMQVIRDRVAHRGPLWGDTPGLLLKAFAARVRGQSGATANLYASIYLWKNAESAATLLAGENFRTVTDSFGRPQVNTWLSLDARAGRADTTAPAQTIYREVSTLASNADIPAAIAAALARNRAAADRADTLAAWVVLDPSAWQLVCFTLSSTVVDEARYGEAYQVWYLARPGLAELPTV